MAAAIDPNTLQNNVDIITGYNNGTFSKRHPALVKPDALGNHIINNNNNPAAEASPSLSSPTDETTVSNTPVSLNCDLLVLAEDKIYSVEEFTVRLLDPGSTPVLAQTYSHTTLQGFPTITDPTDKNGTIYYGTYYKIPYTLNNITPNLTNYFLQWKCKYKQTIGQVLPDVESIGFIDPFPSAPQQVSINNSSDFKIIVGASLH